jgi:hypothetical protein
MDDLVKISIKFYGNNIYRRFRKKTVYKFTNDFIKIVWKFKFPDDLVKTVLNFMDGLIKLSIINFLQTAANFVF